MQGYNTSIKFKLNNTKDPFLMVIDQTERQPEPREKEIFNKIKNYNSDDIDLNKVLEERINDNNDFSKLYHAILMKILL